MSEEMNRYTRLNSGQYINTWSTFLNGHQATIIRLANEESEDEALNELMDGIEENHDIRYHPVWVMGGATEAQSDDPDSPPCSCEGCQPDLCSCDDCQFEGQPTHLQSDDFFGLDSPQPMMFELSPGSSPSPSPCHCDHCQLEDEWQLTLMRLTRESTGNTAHQLESFERIQMAHTPLRHVAWTASHFLDSYRGDEAAPAIWGELQSRLSILHADECPTPNDTPAREVSCCVCLENLPNIILLPCRHTTCSRCANKLKKICPQCREGICGFKKFFL